MYLLNNGNKYEGEFEDGKFNGQGKIFLETQKKRRDLRAEGALLTILIMIPLSICFFY